MLSVAPPLSAEIYSLFQSSWKPYTHFRVQLKMPSLQNLSEFLQLCVCFFFLQTLQHFAVVHDSFHSLIICVYLNFPIQPLECTYLNFPMKLQTLWEQWLLLINLYILCNIKHYDLLIIGALNKYSKIFIFNLNWVVCFKLLHLKLGCSDQSSTVDEACEHEARVSE